MGVYAYRSDFDLFLLERACEAGARAWCGDAVQMVQAEQNLLAVHTASGRSFRGKILIGADGATGMTPHLVRGYKYHRDELGVAACTMYPRSAPGGDRFADDLMTLDLAVIPGGYVWVFPQGSCLNVGVGGSAASLGCPRERLAEALRKLGLEPGGPVRVHPLPTGGLSRKFASGQILLVGDAAGFVDRVSGEGIPWAIKSGALAAEAAWATLRRGEPARAGQVYTKLAAATILPGLRDALRFHRALVVCGPMLGRLAPAFSRRLLERHFEVIAGRASYSDLLRWTLFHLPLGLARGVFTC
jgi:flavin-dependent dehydrogenase